MSPLSTASRVASGIGVLALSLACLGCSETGDRPELGSVEGTVTMDGKPLPGVIVMFQPDSGRAATGTTDDEGYYELTYRYGVEGAKLGPNTVKIEWPMGSEGGLPIPAKYGAKTTLKKEVEEGSNTFNFDLESE